MAHVKHGGMNPREPEAQKAMPKVLRHIVVKEAENGGHMAEHNFEHYEHPAETHVFAKMAKHPVHEGHIFHHLAKHLHIPHEVIKESEHEEALEEKVSPGIHKKVEKMEEDED